MLVLGGGFYLLIQKMFERDYKIRLLEVKMQMQREVIPLRLQAYERITLFLERVSPNNLLYRILSSEMTVTSFQSALLEAIRSEFEHNVTQQVYISPQAWQVVRKAKEDVIRIINTSANELKGDAPAMDLTRKIFEKVMQEEDQPVNRALNYLKSDISQLF